MFCGALLHPLPKLIGLGGGKLLAGVGVVRFRVAIENLPELPHAHLIDLGWREAYGGGAAVDDAPTEFSIREIVDSLVVSASGFFFKLSSSGAP